jgi:signal transduction histidine kinase
LDVAIEVEAPQEVQIRADPVRLGQALDNLIDNAVRHGRPPVRLLGLVDDDTIRIRVSDSGPGVPADVEPKLFERFAMGGPSGATGLGLYLVREIARGHGGDVEYLAAATGERPAFEISLPRRSS